jgi:hypothetical protein
MSRDDSLDNLAAAILFLAVTILFLALTWIVASAAAFVIAVYQYRKYRLEAEKTYQEIADEVGASYMSDEVLQALYGLGIKLADEGWDNPIDWLEGTVMGTTTGGRSDGKGVS